MPTITHTIFALSPIAHGDIGANSGNVSRFRRIPVLSDAGVPIYVPAISAGALRGVVRRLLWREVFDRCGLSRETLDGWDRLYAALANGGTIEAAEKRVDPEKIRERRRRFPVLSLLGAALYTSHMAGRALVSNSWLDCREHPDMPSVTPMRDLLADESRVRHIDAEEQNPDVSGVGPMPTTVETVVARSVFRGHTYCAPALEASAWAHGLDLISHMGGKAAAGFGEVRVEHDGSGAAYLAWLDEHSSDLRTDLQLLAAELAKTGSGKAKKHKAKKDKAPKHPEVDADSIGELF